jgi:integrase
VRVFAGTDPLTGMRITLIETVPAGPRAARQVDKVRTRLIHQIDEGKQSRTGATVDQLLDRYLEVLEVDQTTQARYESMLRLHVRPMLGGAELAKVSGETIDQLRARLRRCGEHCFRRRGEQPRAADG